MKIYADEIRQTTAAFTGVPPRRRFKPDDLGFMVQLRRLPSTTCYINVHPDLITSPGHLYRVFSEVRTDNQVLNDDHGEDFWLTAAFVSLAQFSHPVYAVHGIVRFDYIQL